MTNDEVINLPADTGNIYAVKVTGTGIFDLRVFSYNPRNGRSIPTPHYGLLEIGDKLLLVRTADPIDPGQLQYSGTIMGLSDDKEGFYNLLMNNMPDVHDRLLPIILDTASYTPFVPELFIEQRQIEAAQTLEKFWQYLQSVE